LGGEKGERQKLRKNFIWRKKSSNCVRTEDPGKRGIHFGGVGRQSTNRQPVVEEGGVGGKHAHTEAHEQYTMIYGGK